MSAISITGIVTLPTVATIQMFAGKNNVFSLGTSNAGLPRFFLKAGGSAKSLNGVTTYDDGAVHSLCATYDGANMRIFLDGKQDAVFAKTGAIATSAAAFMLGMYRTTIQQWTGKISDVRVYDRALSLHEVHQLYRQPYADFPLRGFMFLPTAGGGTTISISKGAASVTGKTAFGDLIATPMTKVGFAGAGKALFADIGIALAKAASTMTGKIAIGNETISIPTGFAAFAGQTVTALAALVIDISKAAMTFAGKIISNAAEGMFTWPVVGPMLRDIVRSLTLPNKD